MSWFCSFALTSYVILLGVASQSVLSPRHPANEDFRSQTMDWQLQKLTLVNLGETYQTISSTKTAEGRSHVQLTLNVGMDLTKPVVVSGAAGRVGLQGMGGIGMSVLASALAHRPEVRRAIPDGVYWITLCQEISSPTLVKYCPGGPYGRRKLHPQI